MFLNNVCSAITSRARQTSRIAVLLGGVATSTTGFAAGHSTQATQLAAQATHVIKTDTLAKNVSHAADNLEIIKASGMLTQKQVDSLLAIPSSNQDELLQATSAAVIALRGCQRADAKCAENALPVCQKFKTDIFKCPQYHLRCDGVLEVCADTINQYINALTTFLRGEALEAADAANAAKGAAK